jgi:hypothetical protein
MMSENESASATAQEAMYFIPGTEVDGDNLPSRPFYEEARARASGHMTAPLGSKQRDSGNVILDVPNKEEDAELGSRAQRTLREEECNDLFCKQIQQAWLCCGVLFVFLVIILLVTHDDHEPDSVAYDLLLFFTACAFGFFIAPCFFRGCGGG